MLTSPLRYPAATLVRDGEQVMPERFSRRVNWGGTDTSVMIDGRAALRHFEEGATLFLSEIDGWNVSVADYLRDATTWYVGEAHLSAFMTPPGFRGLRAHVDEVDVIAVQLAGCKEWTLYSEQGIAKGVRLSDGDALYIPRGYLHGATNVGEGVSLHASFTFRQKSVRDGE